MSVILTSALTSATLEGNGVFDVLMRANKAHLEAEFSKNRIKGPEYATVYLGALTQVLQVAMTFTLTQQKAALEAELLEKQILLAEVSITKAEAEVAQVTAQTELITEQRLKVQDEILTGASQRNLIAAQITLTVAQTAKVNDEVLTGAKQRDQLVAQTDLVTQQKTNAVTIGLNLVKEGCVLDSQFDLNMGQVARVAAETSLLSQKLITERAQTTAQSVDDSSVVGRQKLLYQAQTAGFSRNAEQAATKLLVDTWSIRRTTDTGTLANETNQLNDASIGRAVSKMLAGVGA